MLMSAHGPTEVSVKRVGICQPPSKYIAAKIHDVKQLHEAAQKRSLAAMYLPVLFIVRSRAVRLLTHHLKDSRGACGKNDQILIYPVVK